MKVSKSGGLKGGGKGGSKGTLISPFTNGVMPRKGK